MSASRLEKDSLGPLSVPGDAYFGINTVRAVENFPISGLKPSAIFIDAFLFIKKAAALVNAELGCLDKKKAAAIAAASDEILQGKLRDQFVVDVFQMGAGTSLHMNVNEVLANRAIEILGGKKGDYSLVNPNDDVNYAQSTNDVFPTATRLAVRMALNGLFLEIDSLAAAFFAKGKEFDDVIKSARTHLQDAVPIRLGQEFSAYGVCLQKSLARLRASAVEIEELGLGGSAAGTGLNTDPLYAAQTVALLGKLTGLPLRLSSDLREAMQSQRPLAEVSSSLRNLALELTRIANDIRLLCSGPTTGFAEIIVPAVQAGSSIMPGKVNPSMAEMLNMVCFQVIGHDVSTSLAVQAGQLELNVMMPLMAFDLLFSIEILKNALHVFTGKCVSGIVANRDRCRAFAEMSMSLVTVLNPIVGYAKSAEIVKEALQSNKTILDVVRQKNILSPEQFREVFDLKKLTEPGIHKQ